MLQKPTLHLPRSVTLTDVADACRTAVSRFLALPLEKRPLSEWLVGPYAQATSFVPRRRPTSIPPPSSRGPVSPSERIEDIVAHAQAEAHATIGAAATGGPEALVARLPSLVHVLRVEDAFGARGFAPIDAPRMKLNERILSLILADFLTRPDDFVRAMAEPSGPERRITRSGFSPKLGGDGDRRDKDTG
jgi:hypothetical protein